jgi:ATP-dependent DNA helicase RecG
MAVSLKSIHFPEKIDSDVICQDKQRFIFTEFFFSQLELQQIRNHFTQVNRVRTYAINEKIRESINECLQFELTSDQVKVFGEIVNDLKSEFSMQRLLQGDVGVGKTIVAFLALLLAKENGFQGTFLAPTEILANQHFLNAKQFFKKMEIEILTGSTPPEKKKEIAEKLRQGEIDIVFGTHALLNENLRFRNLSLVVIDEQHRFGVSQRAAIYTKGKAVDLLVTTATPIPRTMLLTLFNDLQVSTIREAPAGRRKIITKIIESGRRNAFYQWIKKKVDQGDKIFIVVPLIEKSDFFSNLHSIQEDADYFRQVFAPNPIGIISGKDSADKKEQVLKDFQSGKNRILLCTTVIEVGIDIKDSSIMIIENADRYGLAQLHQLRGRVGRGEIQSYCYLIQSRDPSSRGKERLKIIESNVNGFEIAEMDLRMRGGGMITGLEQSGFLDFKNADIKEHYSVFRKARKDANEVLQNDSLRNNYVSDFLNWVDKKIESISFS